MFFEYGAVNYRIYFIAGLRWCVPLRSYQIIRGKGDEEARGYYGVYLIT